MVQVNNANKVYVDTMQIRIMQLMATGYDLKDIPDMLKIGYATMKFKLAVARGILGARNNTHLMAIVTAKKIVSPFAE